MGGRSRGNAGRCAADKTAPAVCGRWRSSVVNRIWCDPEGVAGGIGGLSAGGSQPDQYHQSHPSHRPATRRSRQTVDLGVNRWSMARFDRVVGLPVQVHQSDGVRILVPRVWPAPEQRQASLLRRTPGGDVDLKEVGHHGPLGSQVVASPHRRAGGLDGVAAAADGRVEAVVEVPPGLSTDDCASSKTWHCPAFFPMHASSK